MGYGNRAFASSGAFQEGDKDFKQFVYNGTSGALTIGMPVYVDCTDAAEFNNLNSTTQLSPAVAASGGKVVLGSDTNAANLYCVGVYQPNNPADAPNKGDAIRVLTKGRGLVSAAAKTAGTAVLVGDLLITDATQASGLSGHNTYTAGAVFAQALATGTAVAKGNSIIAVPGSGTTTALINAYVRID